MPDLTSKGAPYARADDPNDLVLHTKGLADWVTARPGVSPLTAAQRDALTGVDLWDGRVIVNTTTSSVERYDEASDSWKGTSVALDFGETEDVAPSNPGDVGSAGDSGEIARSNHVHAREAARTRTNVLHVVTSRTTNYAVAAGVSLVFASGAITITLPAAADHTGRQIDVKNTGSGTVTVNAAGGQVEGAASASLPAAHSITAVSDGTNWYVI